MVNMDWNLQWWEEIDFYGPTESTEPQRLQEQTTANRRRMAAYRAKQSELVVRFLDGECIPLEQIPRELRPVFLQRQAD